MRQNHLKKLRLVIISLLLLIVHTTLVLADGPQPVLVKDIAPGFIAPGIRNLTDVNGTLFFRANDQLWKSDGTADGTVIVKDNSKFSSSESFVNVNGTLFFTSRQQLWKSDGTSAGTVMIKDSFGGIDELTNVNGTLFFRAWYDGIGEELWRSDGTTAGTIMVDDLNPGPNGSFPRNLTHMSGVLYFVADDDNGTNLWKSDGQSVIPIQMVDTDWAPLGGLTDVNGTLFFFIATAKGLSGVAKSDGTSAGTVLVKIAPWGGPTINVNGTFFYLPTFYSLYKSDGTADGTISLYNDIYGHYFNDMINYNDTLYLITSGEDLWKSNGTITSTVMVKDISGTSPRYWDRNFINVNGTLFFGAAQDDTGHELWQSDGTTSGTVLVKDIRPGKGSGLIDYIPMVNVNGTLFFVADDGVHGAELWRLGDPPSIGPNNSVYLPIIFK